MASLKPFRSGPWVRVETTPEPFNTPPDVLHDAKNGYLPDPPNPTGFYSRPGFSPMNGGDPIYNPGGDFRGQAIYSHEMLDGSRINFLVIAGHLFRSTAGTTQFEDVTPVGVTIDADITTRVAFQSLTGQLVVNDGVNRPWIATNLTSTPITGTYIDYDGASVDWEAFASPTVYGGSIFAILDEVNGISRRADISWSEPGLPGTGWQQTDYDNNWTLSQSNSGPLYAIVGTNLALYYFRERSIGAASGTVGPDLASTATEDAISFNVGTRAWQTIVEFGNSIFFCDAIGRPYVWTPGSAPKDIWKQFRGIVEQETTGFPAVTAITSCATLEPTLTKYLVTIWSPSPASQTSPNRIFVWDAPTGTYEGWWEIRRNGEPINIDCIGTFYDAVGRPTLMILETGGYAWSFNSLATTPQILTTEDDVWLTTEDDDPLGTEGVDLIYGDDGDLPDIYAKTGRFGDDDSVVLNVDQVTVTTLNAGPCRVTVNASMTPSEVEGEPEPFQSSDSTYRLVTGSDAMGRGPDVVVKPLTADEQWKLQRISMKAVPSLAGHDDA